MDIGTCNVFIGSSLLIGNDINPVDCSISNPKKPLDKFLEEILSHYHEARFQCKSQFSALYHCLIACCMAYCCSEFFTDLFLCEESNCINFNADS